MQRSRAPRKSVKSSISFSSEEEERSPSSTNARFFDWPEPYPDPAPYRAGWQRAEDLTAAAAALPYQRLGPAERRELANLLIGLRTALLG